MGGDEPAQTLIAAALSMGKAVVTANKHVIAHHGAELEAIARRTGAALRFEAAVGGGIPVLGPLASDLAGNRIERVRGIVNGTTNFILTAMTDEANPLDYAAALAEAQRLGYAEADPAGDVEGLDAVNKLVILARLAFDRWLDPETIPTRPDGADGPAGPGITTVSLADQADAREAGRIIRLLATASIDAGGAVSAAVLPTALARDSALGRTAGVRNRIEIDAVPVGRVGFDGPGAGGAATSSAVLGDLIAIARAAGSTWGPRPPAPPTRDAAARRARRARSSTPRAASGTRSMTERMTGTPAARPRLVERYRQFLPVTDATPPLTLGEGFTPLVRAERLGAALGLRNLFIKVEGQNPTGSFKDRGMVVAVAKAAEAGARAIVCASTGNTSASAAAYGAAAGLEVIVVLPKGQIAIGKLLQALVAGARVVAIDGNFDQALGIVRALAEQDDHPVTLVNSVNPFRLDGQKTAAFEICDDLGRAPDVLAIPVGNAGNISAYWAGFRDYAAAGLIEATPRMWGFQAAGAAPLVVGHRIEHPETVATAIRIGDPASWTKADRGARRVVGPDQRGDRRRDPGRVPRAGALRGRVLRAGLGGERGRHQQGGRGRRARPRRARRVRPDRPRPQGPDDRRAPRPRPFLEAEPTVGSVAVALGW